MYFVWPDCQWDCQHSNAVPAERSFRDKKHHKHAKRGSEGNEHNSKRKKLGNLCHEKYHSRGDCKGRAAGEQYPLPAIPSLQNRDALLSRLLKQKG